MVRLDLSDLQDDLLCKLKFMSSLKKKMNTSKRGLMPFYRLVYREFTNSALMNSGSF